MAIEIKNIVGIFVSRLELGKLKKKETKSKRPGMCTEVFTGVIIVGIRKSTELAWGCLIDPHSHFDSSE